MTKQDDKTQDDTHESSHTARERMGGESQTPPSHGVEETHSLLAYLQQHGFSRRSVFLVVAALVGIVVAAVIFISFLGEPKKGVPIIGPPPYPAHVKPSDPGGLKVDPSLNPDSDKSSSHSVEAPEQPNLEGLEKHYGLVKSPQDRDKEPADSDSPFVQSAPSTSSSPVSTSEPESAPAPAPVTSLKHQENTVHLGRQEEAQTRSKHGPEIQVQLAAARNDEDARENWQHIKEKYGSFVAQKTPHILRAQLKGATIYRLRLSGFANRRQAKRFCSQARAKQLACIVVH